MICSCGNKITEGKIYKYDYLTKLRKKYCIDCFILMRLLFIDGVKCGKEECLAVIKKL